MPNLAEDSERAYWANEIAALASEGEDTDHIWQRLDLTRREVEEIYRAPEFEAAMRRYGDDVWDAWKLTRAEARQRASIHQKILDSSDSYYDRLHEIAMSKDTKDEVATKILLEFLTSTRQLGTEATGATRVELSPNTVRLLNRGDEILSRHKVNRAITPHVSDNES